MGRRFPADNIPLIHHPLVYLSFLAAGYAASFGIIIALCSKLFRKKRQSSPPPPLSSPLDVAKGITTEPVSEVEKTETQDNEAQTKELPLPPSMVHTNESYISNNLKRVASERKVSHSLSIKIPRSLSLARHRDQKEDHKNKGKMKAEDSVWMKTIILGEKCNPDEEEDPVIYEGKGKKIAAYHPRSVSRQFSYFDPDTLSVPQTQEDRVNNNT